MPVAPVDQSHPSNPVYQTHAAAAVAASAVSLSAVVACEGYDRAAVFVSFDLAHQVSVVASLDEVVWFNFTQHVDTPAPSVNTLAGAFNSVRRVELGGVRFLRIQVINTGASPGTLNSWIALQTRG